MHNLTVVKKCPVCSRSSVEMFRFTHQGRLTQKQAQAMQVEEGYPLDKYNFVSFHHEKDDIAVWMCYSRPV